MKRVRYKFNSNLVFLVSLFQIYLLAEFYNHREMYFSKFDMSLLKFRNFNELINWTFMIEDILCMNIEILVTGFVLIPRLSP